MSKSILALTSAEALDYFSKSEQYHNYELPEYLNFDKILSFVRSKIGDHSLDECLTDIDPECSADVNMDLLLNKDGRYGVRPLTLANPYLYWFLVKELCDDEGWKMSLDCFDSYKIETIESCALPVVKDKDEKEAFHHSASILNWWSSFEQRSLELSLEYRYMFVTDITNCYGTINPQSIEWAFNRKGTSKRVTCNTKRAERIQKILRALQGGRNVGIPQGSVIFDFLGEFVLGYSDLLLHERLKKADIADYRILRYRDDYRVFCNDRDTLEKISYEIQHVLELLNLRLNTSKTKISDNIVLDSIKPDKLYYIENTPIFNKKGVDFDGVEKHMLYILMFGRKFPNGGQLNIMLSDLDKRIEKRLKPRKVKVKQKKAEVLYEASGWEEVDLGQEDKNKSVFSELPTYYEVERPGRIIENIKAIAAVGVQIAIENVSKVHYALRVVSRIVNSIEDNGQKWEIFDKVCARLINRPNSDYDKIWLQNITYHRDKKAGECPYDVPLCQLVMGKRIKLWNNDWLQPAFTKGLPMASICDKTLLKKLTPVITFRETRVYYNL